MTDEAGVAQVGASPEGWAGAAGSAGVWRHALTAEVLPTPKPTSLGNWRGVRGGTCAFPESVTSLRGGEKGTCMETLRYRQVR